MAWPDLSTVQIAHPHVLPWVGAAALLGLVVLVLPRRHSRRAVVLAGLLRVAGVGLLVLLLSGLMQEHESESRFEPDGTWRLLLPGAQVAPGEVVDFAEPADAFVARVRDALTGPNPPARCEVHGPEADLVNETRDRVLALGMPCRAVTPPAAGARQRAVIVGMDAPLAVRPGEAFHVRIRTAGDDTRPELLLNGEPVDMTELRIATPGRHVLEAVLRDDAGRELQRTGHVLRVGDAPSGVVVGLDRPGVARVRELAPNFRLDSVEILHLSPATLEGRQFVVATIDALNRMSRAQAEAVADFVSRGGGLFVTGDGAKYVAPEYLPDAARALLPIVLKKEGKKPPEEDPPVDLEEGLADVTKVSICYVLDASRSMEERIRPDLTRWQVAAKGVSESIKLIRKGGREDGLEGSASVFDTRVAIMSFTLKQRWLYGPLEVARPNAAQIDQLLRERGDDGEFAELGYNTDIYAAMEEALRVMEGEKAAVRVIVLLTDGADRPLHSVEGRRHSDLRDRAVKSGITVYTIGIGDDFVGESGTARSARGVINDLANPSEYAFIPSAADVEKAHVLFVRATETAFRAFDKKKEELEEERKRRLEELKTKGEEPPVIDVLPGVFDAALSPFGIRLFGDAMPVPPPKFMWLARNDARDGAAVAMSADTGEGAIPALAFRGYGLGRVAFWGAGTELEALGELTGWAEFPGVFAASLRWLLPATQPDLRLARDATPDGLQMLDPLPRAVYSLRAAGTEIPLQLDGTTLKAEVPLPPGPAELLEDGSRIADVYVAIAPEGQGLVFAEDDTVQPVLAALPPEVTVKRREAWTLILYLVGFFLVLMPVERLIRRRS